MGQYQDTVDKIEQFVPEFANVKVVPRGTPVLPDLLMTGSVRFGRRLGANVSLLNPDNQMILTDSPQIQSSSITVDRMLLWIEQNAILNFGGISFYQILDYDAATLQIDLTEELTSSLTAGNQVTLWATPLVVHIAAPAGSTQITVRSRYVLVNGDTLTYSTSTELNSLTESNVVLAETDGTDSSDPVFTNIYTLTLDAPLKQAFAVDSPLYIRAYPAYVSQVLRVPKLTSGQMGPFLLDYVATPLDDTVSYPGTFGVRVLDSGGNVIVGDGNSFLTVAQNFPVMNRPLWAENILFWKVVRGSGGFIYPNQYRLITDETGVARVTNRMIPAFQPGITLNVTFTATSAGTVRFYCEPLGYQTYEVQAYVPQTIQWVLGAGDDPVTRLEILANLEPGAEVRVRDTVLQNPLAQQFQYSYCFRVVGTSNFQSTSLVLKPYFLSISDLTATYDSGKEWNGGSIWL